MKRIVLTDGRITSLGPRAAGEVVPLPDPEANEFIREGWGVELAQAGPTAPMVTTTAGVQAPVVTTSGAQTGDGGAGKPGASDGSEAASGNGKGKQK